VWDCRTHLVTYSQHVVVVARYGVAPLCCFRLCCRKSKFTNRHIRRARYACRCSFTHIRQHSTHASNPCVQAPRSSMHGDPAAAVSKTEPRVWLLCHTTHARSDSDSCGQVSFLAGHRVRGSGCFSGSVERNCHGDKADWLHHLCFHCSWRVWLQCVVRAPGVWPTMHVLSCVCCAQVSGDATALEGGCYCLFVVCSTWSRAAATSLTGSTSDGQVPVCPRVG